MQINILKDFSEYPGPRYCTQGTDSGESFYHKILNDSFKMAYENQTILEIDINNTAGYMSSFWDESIGNLVYDFTQDIVKKYIKIISAEEPIWINLIFNKIIPEWEERRIKKEEPKKTKEHRAWFKLIDGNLQKKIWIKC